ncbi:MAG: aminotransferase class V-fold PLP-dependent enzyme [Lachnospiraceae bacterium]|nr:aminotransferase class V-fold PLP-dependent enzyme [Lachnospiraceae bacterium]
MINFTVGPVQTYDYILKIGSQQVPYFRTAEFSDIVNESEQLLLQMIDAPNDSKAVFLTGSGTAAMESVVMNVLNDEDKVLVINGGSFGERFSSLCSLHHRKHDDVCLEFGKTLRKEELIPYSDKGYTALLVNVNETSTGVLYDMNIIRDFCKKNNMLLVADAISSFLADNFSMKDMGVDVAVISSQKALACAPGISMTVMDPKALERVEKNDDRNMYLSLKDALKNALRGQTPFTPAVGIIRQIHARLKYIETHGGVRREIDHVSVLARDFRERIKEFPFTLYAETPSNAVTSVHAGEISARLVFETLKDDYGIWVCPNGGTMAETIFRVGHIGNLSISDNDRLFEALHDMKKRGMLG